MWRFTDKLRKTIFTKGSKKESLITDNKICFYFIFFALVLFATGFLYNSPSEIWHGNLIILSSPANLITDYFEIANIGASLVNASIMVIHAIVIIMISKAKINGLLLAAIFTLAGFSLFGKNLYNSFSIVMGVIVYCKLSKTPFNQYVAIALFGTALGPIVSEVTFNFGLPLYLGILLGNLAGFLSGLLLPVLGEHFKEFHKGFSLYNIGFTAGIIATFFMALFRSFGIEVNTVYLVSNGNNRQLTIFLFTLFATMLFMGMKKNKWSLRGYGELLKESGKGRDDFLETYQQGLVFINMALLGAMATAYVLLVGGQLNGPTICGIFTIAGFGAAGKHIKNVFPILIGVFLVAKFSVHDINSTSAVLAALFGTTLAPISGRYGIVAGVIAGGLHIMFATNISFVNAGMNLYNNGFSGGFVAAVMVPILSKIPIGKGKRWI